jgi:hypothetical protein
MPPWSGILVGGGVTGGAGFDGSTEVPGGLGKAVDVSVDGGAAVGSEGVMIMAGLYNLQ